MKNKSAREVYPLIWLETPVEFKSNNIFVESEITLVVATISNSALTNRERTDITFATTLDPLIDNIISAVNAYKGTTLDKNTIVTKKYFKFDSDESNKATDIWDAIKLKFDMNFNKDCLINKT